MNSQSSLYLELTEKELRTVMASVFPEEAVQSYHLLSGGLFNTTYRVVTQHHDVVLRMGPVHRELLLPYEHNLMAAEALTDRLCLENGIPASKVLHLDTSKALIDRDFMVVERIDSLPLSDPAIPEECKADLLRECGKLLRQLHTVTGSQFGRLAKIVAGQGFACWYDAVESEFLDVFAKAAEYGVFDESLQLRIMAYLAQRKDALNALAVPCLAHCDLWAGNVLVQDTGDSYQLCAIIDGDRAMFGDPLLDISTGWITTPDFLEGYGHIPADPGATERNRVYTLFFTLQDAYIWKIEYQREDIFEENLRRLKEILG